SAAEYYQKYATCLRERNQKDSDTKLAEIVGKMEYDILSNTHKSLKTEFQKTKTELIDHKRRNLIIVIVSLCIILFGVVIILVLNFKRRMAIQERELLRNRMKSTSDLIMRQEEIISNLQRITEKAPDTTKMINELIDKIRDKNDWVSFINEFQIVHPNFIENLSKISDNLTNNDNRIACLIRLQFDNREIAELSNVTYQAILKQKQRLKKKLKLEDGQDLEQFIIKL
ncbi:MAG: hypothetical protein MRY83_18395, partial [Flavobacteriales bacterium]|nr:hypothetical protein [Flavobacteriales bacterium]